MEKINLNGKQQKLLANALIDAFPNNEKFQELAKFKLDKNLNDIISTEKLTLTQIASNLITAAQSEGFIERLMDGALELNPKNSKFKCAVNVITLNHILKPLEEEYIKQMQDCYIACQKLQKKYNNGDSIPDKIDKILNKLVTLNIDIEYFAACLVIEAKLPNLNYLKEWGEKRTENFPNLLNQLINCNNKYEIDKEELYKRLLKLDFFEQVNSFQKVVEKYSVGIYIIHGEQGYGQQWLLNRLVLLITKGQSAKKISIGLNINTYSSSKISERIWHELSQQYGITGTKVKPGEKKSIEIIDAVCRNLQNESVILIFKEVSDMAEKWLHNFIEEVWKPLSLKVSSSYKDSHPHKLLLFVVDLKGSVEQWKIPYDNTHESYLIQKLPKIQKISCDILSSWVQHEIDILPRELIDKIQTDVKETLTKKCKDGEPLSVLEYICEEWGHDWLELENIWLKY